MIELESDIHALEKNLLFPPVTRTQVYISLEPEVNFIFQSVSVKVDNEEKSFHIYSDVELEALRVGGVQRLWEGNVSVGKHQLQIAVNGTNLRGERPVVEKKEYNFEKTTVGSSLELKVLAAGEKRKSVSFEIKDWSEK